MSAIGIAQALGLVVVFGKEERGVGAVNRVFVKKVIHRMQQAFGMIQSDGTLAAQIRLQVGHEKGSGNSFTGNIADDQAEPSLAEIEEVEVIASDLAGLNAKASVFEGLRLREDLGETTGPALGLRFPIPAPIGDRIRSFGRALGVAVRHCGSTHRSPQAQTNFRPHLLSG